LELLMVGSSGFDVSGHGVEAQGSEAGRRASDDLKADVSGNMPLNTLRVFSHEVRTPLNTIVGWAHLLARRNFENEQGVLGCNAIAKSARTIARLVSELPFLVALVMEPRELDIQSIALADIVSLTREIAGAFTARRGIAVHMGTLPPCDGLVVADRDCFKATLSAILESIISGSEKGQAYSIDVKPQDETVEVVINGVASEVALSVAQYLIQLQGGDVRFDEEIGAAPQQTVILLPLCGGGAR
jgi:signal transduction histidine kinase